MRFTPAHRVAQLPAGIFAELAKRKRSAIAAGIDVIDLSIGSPDMPPPPVVTEALVSAVQDTTQYGYSITGTLAFYEAVASFYRDRYSVELDPKEEILQVMGSQEGLSHLATALINRGDTVLVPDPGYPIYQASVQIAEGNLYPMVLREENGFLPNLDEIPQEIAENAKMMILNHPGNPVPSLATPEFFKKVIEFARKYNILVVHDFAYSELVFDGLRPVSFLSIEGAKEVGIEFNSLSKTFNLAGARIGYVAGNPEALAALSLLKSHVDYGIFFPIQHAATVALTSDFAHLDVQVERYEARREALVDGLQKAGWEVSRPHATMFVWAKLPLGWTSSGFALALIERAGVAVTPGDAFGEHGEGYVRIALVQPADRLSEAADRIGKFLREETPR